MSWWLDGNLNSIKTQGHNMKDSIRRWDIAVSASLFLLVSLGIDVNGATVRFGVFQESTNSSAYQMQSFNHSFVETSPVLCGISCFRMYSQCFSFVFDSKTSLCTLGSFVHTPVPGTPPIAGQLYTTPNSYIDVDLNVFSVYVTEGIDVYLHISQDTGDYKVATKKCEALGGHLYTAREEAKYNLLVDLIDGVYSMMWIGLDDLDQEGVFRWVDDNSILTSDVGDFLWGKDQPNNWDDRQDCCLWSDHYKAIGDYRCDAYYNYACEYSVP